MKLSSNIEPRNAPDASLSKPDMEECKAPATQPQLAVEGKSMTQHAPHHIELTMRVCQIRHGTLPRP